MSLVGGEIRRSESISASGDVKNLSGLESAKQRSCLSSQSACVEGALVNYVNIAGLKGGLNLISPPDFAIWGSRYIHWADMSKRPLADEVRLATDRANTRSNQKDVTRSKLLAAPFASPLSPI